LLLPHAFLATSAAFASRPASQEIGLSSWRLQEEAKVLLGQLDPRRTW
jgi:hypothetical protein